MVAALRRKAFGTYGKEDQLAPESTMKRRASEAFENGSVAVREKDAGNTLGQ